MPVVIMALKRCASTQKPAQDGEPLRVVQIVLEGVIEDDDVLADLVSLQKQPRVSVRIDEVPKKGHVEKPADLRL